MPTLFFPDRDSLRLVLASGCVDAHVCRSPATAGFDEQGRLWLTTSAWLPREALVALTSYGVQVRSTDSAAASESVSCWHELLPLAPIPITPEQFSGPVLFELPGHRFAALAGEIERLGRQPYSFRWLHELEEDLEDDRVLVKTVAPPYSSMLRVLDADPRAPEISAYVEQAPNVWVAAGYRHPLAEQIQPPPDKLLFIRPPRGWDWRENLGFSTSINCHDAQQLLTSPSRREPNANAPSLPVPLRLLPAEDDASAEMWLIRGEALGWLERLVRSTDEHLLTRISFALASTADRPCLLLRVHGTKEAPPVLVGWPLGYRPLLKLANLFVPCGYRLAPMPRRDTLRQLLAPDVRRLTWLRPTENGAFHTESVPLSAFRSLKEWIEYRVEETARPREPWRQAAAWEFERYGVEQEPSPRTPAAEVKPKPQADSSERVEKGEEIPAKTKKHNLLTRVRAWFTGSREKIDEANTEPLMEEGAPIPIEEATRAASRLPQDRSLTPPAQVSEARDRVNLLKSRFLSVLTKLTPEDRLYLWPELAKAFADSNNPAESAICWLNALWEQDQLSPSWALGWLRAEAAQAGWHAHDVRLNDWLAAPPNAARARALAAYTVWATLQKPIPPGFAENVKSLQAYLDARESWLPLRAVWLARAVLARMTRGDVLALARTRDRLFDRLLHNGLGLDLDTPAFIRWAESDDPDRFDLVRKWLMDKRHLIRKWIAQHGPEKANGTPDRIPIEQFGLQAEVRCTLAYSDLMLSWGLARLGEKVEGERLSEQARQILDGSDPIHAWLKSAFDCRIRQAREGKVGGGPLPAELLAQLNGLSDDDRYRIDRLRQHSKILDPTERINAYWASTLRRYRHWNDLKKRLIELPGLETAALNERVKHLLAKASSEASAALPAVLLDVLDVAPRLDKAIGEKVLEQVPVALDLVSGTSSMQLRLLEKALLVAASFDQPTKVQLLAHRFTSYIEDQRGLPASTMLEGLTGQTFRCLRRLGLKKEADQVLFQIHSWLTRGEDIPHLRKSRGNDWPSLMRTLLHVAAGWYYCGREDQGHAIIDEVRRDLYDSAMSLPERTALALTYAATLGQVPVRLALGRFEELFLRMKKVTVNGWNTHYTRQPLELVDTVLLAIVSEDFTLGPTVRGWLDDDEYLVRQRIHRELKELMEEQGV